MKEFSQETRVLVAFLLSMLVLVVWGVLYKPQLPPRPQPAPVAKAPTPAKLVPTPATATAPKAAAEEKAIVVENDLYRVELSNRGAVVRSWQLKKYTDDHKPPRVLDVVHPDASQESGGWPLSVALEDAQLETQVNAALFDAAPAGGTLHAPATVEFQWSDGRLSVTKRLRFDRSYIVELESTVLLEGRALAHAIAWRGGFGDTTVSAPAERVQIFFRTAGKVETLPHKKLGTPDQPVQRLRQIGTMEYAGIEDKYFAAAFLPRGAGLALWHWKLEHETVQEKRREKVPVAEMAAGSIEPRAIALRLYVGPKALDELGKLNPPLAELVQFGWFGVIAAPMFYFLKWIYDYVPNYGWAIVLMTVVINTVLYPLKVKSFRSMQKMQKVAPEIRAIQDRYKKYAMRDPRKQQMQPEIMAVYKREGINPMGGCLPMVLQMPIWIGLYRMLDVAIELRHTPWLVWIKDLSAPDPYYVLPILMTVTMYLMQKMTPMTTADPAQQRMMNWMPFLFGFLFLQVSSGLVVYILTSNLIGMAQQWHLNRTAPAESRSPRSRKEK